MKQIYQNSFLCVYSLGGKDKISFLKPNWAVLTRNILFIFATKPVKNGYPETQFIEDLAERNQ